MRVANPPCRTNGCLTPADRLITIASTKIQENLAPFGADRHPIPTTSAFVTDTT